MGKAVQDPEAKGKRRPANPAPSRPIKHPNSLSLPLRFLPIPFECENLFPFPRSLFAIALRPLPLSRPSPRRRSRSVRPSSGERRGGTRTERRPLSSFVELISPAAKIAACHSGIGVQLIRLTL